MNLKEIREEINSALDYNPDLKQYSDNIARVVNRHYLQISSQYQWLFMQNRNLLQLRADITGDSTSSLTGNDTHFVALPTDEGAGIKNLPSDIVGKTLVNNDDGSEYRITAYVDARKFVVDKKLLSGTYTNWTIKFIRYPMPKDCIEVLGIMDRGITNKEVVAFTNSDKTTTTMTAPNRGRFMFLDARKEENLYLDRSDTGDPFVSVEEMHDNIQAPNHRLAVENNIKTLSSGGSLLPRIQLGPYTIEYCYTFEYAGMEGPPSEVLTIDLDASLFVSSVDTTTLTVDGLGHPEIVLMNFQNTRPHSVTAGTATEKTMSGRMKKLYRRIILSEEHKKNNLSYAAPSNPGGTGSWRHIATIAEAIDEYVDVGKELGDETIAVSGSATFSSLVDPSGESLRLERLYESGPRSYLRFWQTPKSDYMVEVRYHKRPHRLVKDSDSPEWPPQYHHYLVYAALRDICMQHSMLNHSQLYEGRADEILAAMRAKYLSRTDRMYVRRGFDRAMADRERFGIPSKAE